jgi:biopolymer transport protein ExbB
MRRVLIALLALSCTLPAPAAQSDLDALLQRLKQERLSEQSHHREREARFLAERDQRQGLLEQALQKKQQAETLAEQLRTAYQANEQRLHALEEELAGASGELNELFDAARQHAADTRARQKHSIVSVQFPDGTTSLDNLADSKRLPTSGQLEGLWLSLLEEMNRSGKVTRFEAPVIAPDGTESARQVLRIGTFSAVSEGRYLRYLPEAGRFVEPARQPPLRDLRLAGEFDSIDTGVGTLAVDPSRGALLGLMGRAPDLLERIRQGGVIGYVILGLGAFGLLLVLERFLVLVWVQLRMRGQRRRDRAHHGNPLGRLSLVAETNADASLEALDMHLDEAAAREASRLTRGLTTLGVVAAMAPLLGLLGTVTGMIETFQTITLFGSGDPKLMSSGISQALVTTQLGLVVAVPVLLLHSFLKGRANRLIEQLDGHVSLLLGGRA